MPSKNLVLALLTTYALFGCASAGVTPVGGAALSPLAANARVLIYTSEKDVQQPFKVVGLVSYTNPGKYQVLSLASVMPELQAEARKAGANGLIIDESHAIKSGFISTGIGVTGRAIVVSE